MSSVSHEDIRCDRMSNYDDTVTLERCIELFSEAEILEEEDFWYCSCCKVGIIFKTLKNYLFCSKLIKIFSSFFQFLLTFILSIQIGVN